MFTTFKLTIEKWLRGLIAEEVSKIDTSLNSERQAMCNLIGSAGATLNTSLVRLNELSHIKEATTLRAHIRDLESGITEVSDLVKKIHPSVAKK